MSLRQGDIIEAEVLDPNGANLKPRPIVILTPTEEISSTFVGVAISAQPVLKASEMVIEIRSSEYGHPKTGLWKKSHAICEWVVEVTVEEIHKELGYASKRELAAVLNGVNLIE